jgi:hypothetical protein
MVSEVLRSGPTINTPKRNQNRKKFVTGADDFVFDAIRNVFYEMRKAGNLKVEIF